MAHHYLPATTFAHWQQPMCLVSGEKFPLCKEALNRYFTLDRWKQTNIPQMGHTCIWILDTLVKYILNWGDGILH